MAPTGTKWFSGWEHGRRPQAADIVGADDVGLLWQILNESSTDLIVTASAARTGSYGLRLIHTTLGRRVGYETVTPPSASIVVSGYIRFPGALPSATHTLFSITKNVGTACSCQFDSATSKFTMNAGGGGSTVQGTDTVSADVWYRIEARVDMSSTTVADWQVAVGDETAVVQTQATSTDAATTGRWLRLGTSSTVTSTVDYDDWVLSYDSSDYPIGPQKVLGFTVDQAANAEHQSITTTEWQYTDDFSGFTNFASGTETDSRSRLASFDSTSGVRMNAAGAVAGNGRWKMAAPAGLDTDPYAVQVITPVRESAAGTNNATLRMLLSGSTSNIFSGDPGWGTTWNWLRLCMATTPAGGAWAQADVDALRYEMDSTDAAPEIWCAAIHGEAVVPPSTTQVMYRTVPPLTWARGG